jgi:hypothetical protein
VEISYQPEPLATPHLRGVVWRRGVREFELRAFLTDLSWQDRLFAIVQDFRDPAEEKEPTEDLRSPDGVRTYQRLGGAWTVEGNPFLQVQVSDMGLIRAEALWTERALPDDASPIIGRFTELLKQLDS